MREIFKGKERKIDMIINNPINYNIFVNITNIRAADNKPQMLFQNELSSILSGKESASNDNSSTLQSDLNNFPLPQNCAIDKERTEEADQNKNDTIAEDEEKAKDMFTICFECANKEECEHYQKMINGDESVKGNAVFSPIKTSRAFHKNEVTFQNQLLPEELYKSTVSSIIYNYNIICPDIYIKARREKR